MSEGSYTTHWDDDELEVSSDEFGQPRSLPPAASSSLILGDGSSYHNRCSFLLTWLNKEDTDLETFRNAEECLQSLDERLQRPPTMQNSVLLAVEGNPIIVMELRSWKTERPSTNGGAIVSQTRYSYGMGFPLTTEMMTQTVAEASLLRPATGDQRQSKEGIVKLLEATLKDRYVCYDSASEELRRLSAREDSFKLQRSSLRNGWRLHWSAEAQGQDVARSMAILGRQKQNVYRRQAEVAGEIEGIQVLRAAILREDSMIFENVASHLLLPTFSWYRDE